MRLIKSYLRFGACLAFLLILAGCGVSSSPAQQTQVGPTGPPGLIYAGPYVPGTSYVQTNWVTYNNSSYYATADNTKVAPSGDSTNNAFWSVLALKGTDGTNGIGQPGPPGPPASNATSSPWYQRKYAVFGDSYSAYYSWQTYITDYHGMTQGLNTALGGWRSQDALSCYSGSSPQTLVNRGDCGQYNSGKAGNTLAQDLAGIDLILIELGGNDFLTPLGSPSDGVNAATEYGYVRNLIETLQTVAPTARIVWITPAHVADPIRVAFFPGIIGVIKYVAEDDSVIVIDEYKRGGLDARNWSIYVQPDLVHLTDAGYRDLWAAYINVCLNGINPLTGSKHVERP